MLSSSPALQNCYNFIQRFRTQESIKNKRRRYREKKKQKQKERVQIQTTVTLPDTPVSEPLTSDINVDVSLDHDQSNTSMSTWSRGPGSDRWDILLDEAERFRLYLSEKKAVLNDKYGGFHDEELSFPDDLNFTLPESLSGIDSVCLQSTSRDAEEGKPCPISCTILPR